MLLAHQGGWDEILLVLAPIAVIVGLLRLASTRATRLADERDEPIAPADTPLEPADVMLERADPPVEPRSLPVDLADAVPPPPSGPGRSAD